LASLHNKYSNKNGRGNEVGFTVLAFPSNDFHQEKDTNEEILEYIATNFPQVTFPLFARSETLMSNMVFQLCQQQTNSKVEWNFHKFLVNGRGQAVKSYGHRVSPMDIEEDIVRLMEEEREIRDHDKMNEDIGLQVPQTF
jgi:glutathione peroxidase